MAVTLKKAPAIIAPAHTPIPPSASLHLRKPIERYTRWLEEQARQAASIRSIREVEDYIRQANKIARIKGREIAVFAPFQPEYSAFQTWSRGQVSLVCAFLLVGISGLLIFGIQHILAIALAQVTLMYLVNLAWNMLTSVLSFHHLPEEHIDPTIIHALKDAHWPRYTILCPLYRETQVVPQFIQAMKVLDYPISQLQILLLTEECDNETREALQELALPAHFHILTVPEGYPRTKPRACNYGLLQANGQYIVIYDAEDIPDPLQLKKALLAFANHDETLGCVQAKLNFYNTHQNILTRWFTSEYSLWFDLVLPGLQNVGCAIPLGGTSNHFRTSILRKLGGWDAFNVTEDCDLGLRMARAQLQTVVLDSTTYEEANSQLTNWLRQRSRWIKGYMQTYLVHMRHPSRYIDRGRIREFFSLQILMGSGTSVLFLNPLMWTLLIIYIFFGPQLVDTYHHLFPKPIMLSGTLCLIFGNFYYIYLYLLGCIKRRQYRLVPWTLLIPCYWMMISIAGFLALFELLIKPHYWQKTLHGLHFNAQKPASAYAMPLILSNNPLAFSTQSGRNDALSYIGIVAAAGTGIGTLRRQRGGPRIQNIGLFATLLTSCIASISACIYYVYQHQILLYADAYSHLRLARSVIDSITPGIAQLGGVWLPLPHLLMLPLIWNNTLWHSGLAGSIVSMLCYIASAAYVYLSAQRLTQSGGASFLCTLLFIFNPDILYLQATPLSELVWIWTMTMTAYYFLRWAQMDRPRDLLLAAASSFLATLSRYEGWIFFLWLILLVAGIGLLKQHRREQIQSNVLLFGSLGGFGIALWLLWNQVIFGDLLYFQHGALSPQVFLIRVFQSQGLFYTYHNLRLSFLTYALDAMQTCGPTLFVAAACACGLFLLRQRLSPSLLAATALLIPFLLYVYTLYTGQAIIWIPGAVPHRQLVQVFNVRYGATMVVPMAIFLAVLVHEGSIWLRHRLRTLIKIIMSLLILVQMLQVATGYNLALEDGLRGASCIGPHPVNLYLAQHYSGGRVLLDLMTDDSSISEAGLDFSAIVYDGSGPLWSQALHHPANIVEWVIIDRSRAAINRVAQALKPESPAFIAQFSPAMAEPGGLTLYHRNGSVIQAARKLPSDEFNHNTSCHDGGMKYAS